MKIIFNSVLYIIKLAEEIYVTFILQPREKETHYIISNWVEFIIFGEGSIYKTCSYDSDNTCLPNTTIININYI